MIKTLLILFIFPFFVFGNGFDEYGQEFLQTTMNFDFDECFEILYRWESDYPEENCLVNRLRAATLMGTGRFEESRELMESTFSYPQLNSTEKLILCFYDFIEEMKPSHFLENINHRKDKMKFNSSANNFRFFGGAVVAVIGLVTFPVQPYLGGSLIALGTTYMFNGHTGNLEERERFQNSLKDRRKIDEQFERSSHPRIPYHHDSCILRKFHPMYSL